MKILAFIPARGGSKGVKDKNLKLIAGKPLIKYAVECAQQCSHPLTIVVNSDSDAILSGVGDDKSVVLQKRDACLAEDDTPVTDVLFDALQRINETFDLIVLMQPTSPIRSGQDLDSIIAMFIDDRVDGVVSVVPMDDMHPARMYNLSEDAFLIPYEQENEVKRRQKLIPVYYRNGCFYAVRADVFLEQRSLMPENKKAYVMSVNHLANIDSPRDLIVTEALLREWREGRL